MITEERTTIIEFTRLSKMYRLHGTNFSDDTQVVTALDDVSGTIRQGSLYGIVGESGSGKSTLMRLLMGAEKPTHGNIIYQDDFSVVNASKSDLAKYQARIKMVFQDPARSLNHRLTIMEIFKDSLLYSPFFKEECDRLGIISKRARVQEIYERVLHHLKVVGLSESILDHYPTEFSGGQRQRIAIVRALIHYPEILICDEITSSLDASTRRSIVDILLTLRKTRNVTVVIVSHDLEVVYYACDDIIVMSNGNIVDSAHARELFSNPTHEETRKLIDNLPKFPPRVE